MPPEYVSELRVVARTVDGRTKALELETMEGVAAALACGDEWLSTVDGGLVATAHIVSLEPDYLRRVLGS